MVDMGDYCNVSYVILTHLYMVLRGTIKKEDILIVLRANWQGNNSFDTGEEVLFFVIKGEIFYCLLLGKITINLKN